MNMKPITAFGLAFFLAACGGGTPSNGNASAPKMASAPEDAAEINSVRDNFVHGCVDSAVNNPSAKTAPSPEKRQFAQTVCECVYDSSEQAYGSAQWLETVKQAEQQQTMDTKLQQTIQTAMQQCAQQYFAQVQSASDATAAK